MAADPELAHSRPSRPSTKICNAFCLSFSFELVWCSCDEWRCWFLKCLNFRVGCIAPRGLILMVFEVNLILDCIIPQGVYLMFSINLSGGRCPQAMCVFVICKLACIAWQARCIIFVNLYSGLHCRVRTCFLKCQTIWWLAFSRRGVCLHLRGASWVAMLCIVVFVTNF